MIRSNSLAELNAALSAAQGEFEAVSKTADNPFFKSKYAALPDVVKAATPILTKHGLAVWQGADTDDHGELLWTVVLHSSGQFIGSAARMLPVKKDPQAQGSAVTYGRRYQYMSALGLVADTDDDGNSASGRSKASSRARSSTRSSTRTPAPDGHSDAQEPSQAGVEESPPVSTETLEKIALAARRVGLTPAQWKPIVAEAGAEGRKSNELTEDQASWVLVKLGAMPAKATQAKIAV